MIFQTILKLLNKNFLYILFKTQSVAYLHIGLSDWHETQVTTSPWATKALWKNGKLTSQTPPRPFDWFAANFASSVYRQNLSKAFYLRHTCWSNPFWCFAIKPSTHYNFHIQFSIYSKLLKHGKGLALNTSTWHTPTAACPDTDCEGPFIATCSFNWLFGTTKAFRLVP